MAFNEVGTILASGSYDKTIKLWSIESHTEITTLIGNYNNIMCFSFSPCGKILASGSYDSTIKLWDIELKIEKNIFKGHD